MILKKSFLSAMVLTFLVISCTGMKFVNPEDPNVKNKGTLALDISDGHLKVVGTYTCKLLSPTTGVRLSAIGKTESEARAEVVAKCRDNSLISICKPENAECVKN